MDEKNSLPCCLEYYGVKEGSMMEHQLDEFREKLHCGIIEHNYKLIDEDVIKLSLEMDKLINDYIVYLRDEAKSL